MVEIYKRHYAAAADIVLRKQDEIIRLERKVKTEDQNF